MSKMVQWRLNLGKLTAREFVATLEGEDDVWMDTVFESVETAKCACPGEEYRTVEVSE